MNRENAERVARGLAWFSIGLGAAEVFAPKQMARLIGVRDNDRRRKILRTFGAREVAAGTAILAQSGTGRMVGVWSRVGGDLMDISTLGKAYSTRGANRKRLSIATAAVLGVTALDVICGLQLSASQNGDRTMRVRRTIIIGRAPGEVYPFWRDANNWARIMDFGEVQNLGNGQMRWTVRIPGLREVSWDTRITSDIPESMITWRSMEDAEIDMMTTLRFEPAPGDRGTMVSMEVQFVPPGGALGAAIAKMLTRIPKEATEICLQRAKQLIETGEIARSDASIFMGPHAAQPPEQVPEPAFSH